MKSYFFLNTAGGGGTDTDGEDIVAGSSDDPLEKAKRIMDKYK